MALIPVNAAGQYGIVNPQDTPPHELPLNAWSNGRNVRMRDAMVEKFLGHQQAFGTPGTQPYFAIPLFKNGVYYWIYTSLTKAFVWDGNTHTDITRAAGNYAANALRNWTGGALGGIPILNNGVDVPQMWLPVSLAQPLQALTNWPATYRAGAMRVFRRFLVALDINKDGTLFPQMIKWSHPAPSGGVPTSWDETDETKDAGEYEILDSDGACVDAARMREDLIIYKDDSVHRMQYIGGIDIFRFLPMFDNFGILSRRCAVEYAKGRHAVFAVGDVISHDGVSWQSIISSRLRKWLFQQIDPTNFATCFVALNPAQFEVWFCFPSIGQALPNMAIVWNWTTNALGIREIAATHIANGNVSLTSGSDIWDADFEVWDSDSTTWGEGFTNPAGRRLLICDPANTKLHFGDSTQQFAGVNMTSFIERVSLPLPVKPDGPPDMRSRKFIRDLYPRLLGTTGAVVKIHLGTQEVVDGPISWRAPRDFIIGTTKKIDVRVNTPLLAVRYESTTNIDWRLAGQEFDVSPAGR
jgi:hypothetical protein